jgi:perosamine synthetase
MDSPNPLRILTPLRSEAKFMENLARHTTPVDSISKRERISVARPIFNGNEEAYLMQCLKSGWVSSAGEFIKRFENEFAQFSGAKHGICCFNGTVALHLALMAQGIGPGDEVLIPAVTYIATANAVAYCGAKPVLVDCDRETWNIDPARVEAHVTSRTKAIIPVHLFGFPVDMDPILALAKKHNLFVLEDAAEAHGAKYKGHPMGSMGNAGVFSFFGNKVITTGEGGMVVTNDDELAGRMQILRNQGMSPDRRYWFPEVGYNYRMTNLQAALGVAQLERIEWHLNRRQEIAAQYLDQLSDLTDLIELPATKSYGTHIYWMFTVMIKDTSALTRDQLITALDKDGIESRPIFYPLFLMPPYQQSALPFPVSNFIGRRGISLPTHGGLTPHDVQYVAERIRVHCLGINT